MLFRKKRGGPVRSMASLLVVGVIVGAALNYKDIQRYLKMRAM